MNKKSSKLFNGKDKKPFSFNFARTNIIFSNQIHQAQIFIVSNKPPFCLLRVSQREEEEKKRESSTVVASRLSRLLRFHWSYDAPALLVDERFSLFFLVDEK